MFRILSVMGVLVMLGSCFGGRKVNSFDGGKFFAADKATPGTSTHSGSISFNNALGIVAAKDGSKGK
jgi:hypothetical protein